MGSGLEAMRNFKKFFLYIKKYPGQKVFKYVVQATNDWFPFYLARIISQCDIGLCRSIKKKLSEILRFFKARKIYFWTIRRKILIMMDALSAKAMYQSHWLLSKNFGKKKQSIAKTRLSVVLIAPDPGLQFVRKLQTTNFGPTSAISKEIETIVALSRRISKCGTGTRSTSNFV